MQFSFIISYVLISTTVIICIQAYFIQWYRFFFSLDYKIQQTVPVVKAQELSQGAYVVEKALSRVSPRPDVAIFLVHNFESGVKQKGRKVES